MAGGLRFCSDLDYGARCSLCGHLRLCRSVVNTETGCRLEVCLRCWRSARYGLSTTALADIEEAARGLDTLGEDETGKEME